MVYDTTLNALRFNNAANYANVVVAKDLANNLSGINNVNTTGTLGLNTTTPAKQLDVNSSTGDCLRLTYNASTGSATNYVDFLVSTTGSLSMTPSGGFIDITTHNGSTLGLKLGGSLVTATADQLNYTNTTPGSLQPSKAFVTDANRNMININYMEVTTLSAISASPTDNTTVNSFSLIGIPTNTAAIGLGIGMEFDLVNDAGNVFSAGFINCVSSAVVDSSEKAYYEFKLINSGSLDTIMTLSNAGVLTSTSFVETSDERVKENIQPMQTQYSLDKLMQVDIKSYNYTFDADKKNHTGVIAQEIEKVLPEVVHIEKKGDIEDFHSVHYAGLVPHLINAVKQLKKEIDELKQQQQ
jgi:hypothetical protein